MSSNQIESIEACVFVELISLKELDICKNKISKLVPESFKGLKSLEKLTLNFNQIESIEECVFAELSSLILLN